MKLKRVSNINKREIRLENYFGVVFIYVRGTFNKVPDFFCAGI